ncbi:type I restriction enzyme, R subunit/putative DNA methylase [Ectothiorhodospira mobilis]|uniref:Type I restriction enzyme, R subunit/putative DNA methylase n=2 Tax=Ectothiorhodospira mobilis TaxID=195064 RepID=A0A1I4P8F8_ECTMO|nr:type I restriction enzyme, R subunit/putative DNA methylase [Ectothiorhodospira mobilis]
MTCCGSKGWYTRGYLPHLDARSVPQSITFRLADSLPQEKCREWARELEAMPAGRRDRVWRRTIDDWLDAGMGCCALRHPRVADVVQETLLRFDGSRYRLLAWCVMPNHVHVLIEPADALPKIVQSWKSYTGRWALARNAELGLGVPGARLWMREYWDRYIRDQRHLDAVVEYIHRNPVKAGLCGRPEEWLWSSASRRTGIGATGD